MQLPGDGHRSYVLVVVVRLLPGEPEPYAPLDILESTDARQELVEEQKAAHLTVRDDIDPSTLLQIDRLVDRSILDPLEIGSRVVGPASQSSRAALRYSGSQQGADHLCTVDLQRTPPSGWR